MFTFRWQWTSFWTWTWVTLRNPSRTCRGTTPGVAANSAAPARPTEMCLHRRAAICPGLCRLHFPHQNCKHHKNKFNKHEIHSGCSGFDKSEPCSDVPRGIFPEKRCWRKKKVSEALFFRKKM